MQEKQIVPSIIKQETEGLPNVGNTCFISSIIHCLYSSQHLREQLIKQLKNGNQLSEYASKIAQIFLSIKLNENKQIKAKLLSQFATLLSKDGEFRYKLNSQQDSLNYLMNIIQLLNVDIFSFKLDHQMFAISYNRICQNQNNLQSHDQKQLILIEKQLFLNSKQQTCNKCQKLKGQNDQSFNNFYNLVNISYNIIMHNQYEQYFLSCQQKTQQRNQVYVYRPNLYLLHFNQNKPLDFSLYKILLYTLKSKSLYKGDGYSGHYVAIRKKISQDKKQSNNFYKFDDLKMNEILDKQNKDDCKYKTKFALYGLVSQISCMQIMKKNNLKKFITQIHQQNNILSDESQINNQVKEIQKLKNIFQVLTKWNKKNKKEIHTLKNLGGRILNFSCILLFGSIIFGWQIISGWFKALIV